MDTLKFEGFKVGQTIKAFDFEPCEGRRDRYVVGRITEVVREGSENLPHGYYWIEVIVDTIYADGDYRRRYVAVPMQTSMDYDGRVTLIEVTIADVILENEGGVLDSTRLTLLEGENFDSAIQDVIGAWELSVGDSIRIVETEK